MSQRSQASRTAPYASTSELLVQALRVLGLNHPEAGKVLGVSRRTIGRWVADRSMGASFHFPDLIVAVHARDPQLAARMAAHIGKPLESFVALRPASVASPALRARLVDAVVCAAADAMHVAPAAVRPALQAAFASAREMGLTHDDMAAALAH